MSAKCNLCESPIIWDQPYVKGSRPKNEDGSTHSCRKSDGLPSDEGSNKRKENESVLRNSEKQTPITSVSALAECLAFKNMFFDVESDIKYDALARIYISRMMSRR